MCMFLPMEVITIPERIKVVEVGSLIEIPSQLQVRQAISMLCKKQEEYPDKFSYIKFPFGMIDYGGLNALLTYHEYLALRKKVAEEKAWLKQSKQNCEGLGINFDKINQYFRDHVWSTDNYNPITSIRNITGKRWLSDDVIDRVFDIINMKHDDTVCFVCKPTRIMYSSTGLNDKMHSIRDNGITLSKVIVALNVGCDDDGTYYVSDEKWQGVHWALLVIDLKNGTTYYGDSLGWSLPSNLASTVGSNLKRMEEDLGIKMTSLENIIININKLSCDAGNISSDTCKWFYPLQSCSHVCGVIVVCMAAVLCDHWNLWLTSGSQMEEVHVSLLSNPSMNSRQLRLIVLSWIVNDNVNTCHIVPEKQKIPTIKDNCDTPTGSGKITKKSVSVNACKDNTLDADTSDTKVTMEHAEVVNNPVLHIDSDDDFMPTKCKKSSKHPLVSLNDSDSDDDLMKSEKVGRPLILSMLPDGYTYKMVSVTQFKDLNSFNCEFKIKLETEEGARKWIAEYNKRTKETMVYDCCKNLSGKRVIKKMYLRCQYKQRQTGMHTKSTKTLKTTHKQHNNKNTDCPAQIVVTLLPPKKHDGFCVDVTLKHTHNHLVDVADALRFRPVAESTKEKYYD